jgi:photosystem II stability/assembly factor-like uncharacterized protein
MTFIRVKTCLLFLLLQIFLVGVAGAEWVKVSEPCRVRGFYYDAGSGVTFAVTEELGVLKSTNGGSTWTAKNTGLDEELDAISGYNLLRDITADKSGNLYLCSYSRFFKSTDGGETWQRTAEGGYPVGGGDVKSMTFDPYTDKLFVVSNGDGIYRSADGGNTWERVDGGTANVYSIYSGQAEASGQTGMLLAGTYTEGIKKSADGGDTWAPKGSFYWMTDFIEGPNHWLFAISSDRIDRSMDFGDSWSTVYSYPGSIYFNTLLAYDEATGYLYAATSTKDLLHSADGGNTWERVTVAADDNMYTSAVISLPNDTLLVGTMDGIYRQGPAIVNPNQSPAVPTLTYPALGASTFGTSIRLYWQNAIDPEGGIVTYRLQLAEDANFTLNLRTYNLDGNGHLTIVLGSVAPFILLAGWRCRGRKKATLAATAISMLLVTSLFVGCDGSSNRIGDENTLSAEVTGLESGKTYYWRVVAVDNQDAPSAPSETWSFTISL